jgi:signal peptidase I
LKLPVAHLKGHNLRAFEVQSNSGYPAFLPGDVLIAEKLDPALGVKSISNGKFYVVVTKNNILIHKIDLNSLSKGYVNLYLDNKEEKITPIKLSEILEFWEVRLKVTRNIENENMTLNALLSEIKDIRQLLFNSSNALV